MGWGREASRWRASLQDSWPPSSCPGLLLTPPLTPVQDSCPCSVGLLLHSGLWPRNGVDWFSQQYLYSSDRLGVITGDYVDVTMWVLADSICVVMVTERTRIYSKDWGWVQNRHELSLRWLLLCTTLFRLSSDPFIMTSGAAPRPSPGSTAGRPRTSCPWSGLPIGGRRHTVSASQQRSTLLAASGVYTWPGRSVRGHHARGQVPPLFSPPRHTTIHKNLVSPIVTVLYYCTATFSNCVMHHTLLYTVHMWHGAPATLPHCVMYTTVPHT